jgi:hypothetical protein
MEGAGGFDLSSRPDPANYAGFALVLVLLAVFATALWLLQRVLAWRDRPPKRSMGALFRELCRAHRLSWRERLLLGRLARAAQVAPAARLFVEPELFDGAGADRAVLQSLKVKLFGTR